MYGSSRRRTYSTYSYPYTRYGRYSFKKRSKSGKFGRRFKKSYKQMPYKGMSMSRPLRRVYNLAKSAYQNATQDIHYIRTYNSSITISDTTPHLDDALALCSQGTGIASRIADTMTVKACKIGLKIHNLDDALQVNCRVIVYRWHPVNGLTLDIDQLLESPTGNDYTIVGYQNEYAKSFQVYYDKTFQLNALDAYIGTVQNVVISFKCNYVMKYDGSSTASISNVNQNALAIFICTDGSTNMAAEYWSKVYFAP